MVFLGCLGVSAGAEGATDFTFRPEVAIARIYDSNLFFTGDGEGDRQRDVLTRVTPVLGAEWTSPRLNLVGRAGVDAEEYNEYKTLNSSHNRRFGTVTLEYRTSEKLAVSADMDYTDTMTPGEFNTVSGLEPGRIRASRIAVSPGLEYRFSPRTTGSLALRATRDRLEGGVEGNTRELNLVVEQAAGERSLVSYGYRFRHYQFNQDAGPDSVVRTHLPKLGWTYRFSQRTGITLEGGPRISSMSTDPYFQVRVGHEYDNGVFDMNYAQDEVNLIGELGRFETETAGFGVTHRMGPDLELQLTPSYGQVRSETSVADVIRADLRMNYRINNYLNFVTSYQYYDYKGTGFGAPLERALSRNVFLLGIEVEYPGRSR